MTSTAEHLSTLDENWNNALAIVAHPDDLEYGAAAGIARWTSQGKNVAYSLVTQGEAGIDALPPEQTRPLRVTEQRASASVVGVETVEFMDFPDGMLEYGLTLRKALARTIRRHRPEIVITTNFRETWYNGLLNQADHIATGHAIVDAIRDAGNRWVFPELTEDGIEPWNGVRQLWASWSPLADQAVDVTEHLDSAVRSLEEHRAYLDGLGNPDFDPKEFLSGMCQMVGSRTDFQYAVAFEVLDF